MDDEWATPSGGLTVCRAARVTRRTRACLGNARSLVFDEDDRPRGTWAMDTMVRAERSGQQHWPFDEERNTA